MDINDAGPVYRETRIDSVSTNNKNNSLEPLLFLCHRIPFPANKGDKITTFNLMKYLSERFELYLGCFIDDPFDVQYKDDVRKFCKDVCFINIENRSQLSSGISSLMKSRPVSITHYDSPELQDWIDTKIDEHNIEKLFIYSSGMAQFVEDSKYKNKVRVLDMADVDSDKWLQYANNKPIFSSWIYTREYKLLKSYEQKLLADFQAITLITDEERDLFRSLSASEYKEKIVTLSNGVDTEYFSPLASFDYTDKPDTHQKMICFTGAMDYWANVDAVVWFCEEVWPKLKILEPELVFYIVGGKPTEKVQKLAILDGVYVTGRVVDVRPYVAASQCCVGPLRIARGVQNKVLEAMAMAKPVVMTSMAQEGITMPEEQQQYVCDDPDKTALLIHNIVKEPNLEKQLGEINRNWIVSRYSWNGALAKLDTLLDVNTQ